MSHPLENCLVRIYYSDESRPKMSCGTGVTLSQRRILTCAHVIKEALRLHGDISEKPEKNIILDFPLASPNKTVNAKIIFWDIELDIAGLEVIGEVPKEVQPASLHIADDFWGHQIQAFGFPDNHPGGTWADSELREKNAFGWIEIFDPHITGYFIQPGFSGGPVWDANLKCCVGIVVATDKNTALRTSYLIPTHKIAEKWKDLPVERTPRRSSSRIKKEFPSLLPYQVNCWNQRKLLEDIYKNSRSNSPRPIVVLVHGNADQAHDMFLSRLIHEFIPAIINSNSSINNIHLRWPRELNTAKDLGKGFTENLGEHVLYNPSSSCDEIQKNLATDSRVTIVDTELSTDDWLKHKSGVLETFLDYWQSWPELQPHQNLFVFLLLSYKTAEKSYVKNLLYSIRKRQILMQISQCGFHHYPKIVGAVMPELIGISQPDVEEWVRTQARDYFGDDVTIILSKIRHLYEKDEQLSMETLAFRLKEILSATSGD